MPSCRWIVLAAAVWVWPALARADVDAWLGLPVVSVRLSLEGEPLADARRGALIETTPGAPLTTTGLRKSISHLYSRGDLEDVQVHVVRSGVGVALTFDLVPVHPIVAVEFVGERGVTTGALRRLLQDRFGARPRRDRAGEMAGAVAQAMADEGYLRATVTPDTTVRHAPDRALVTFRIVSGPQVRISETRVDGLSGADADALRARLRVLNGAPYRRRDLDARLEAARADLAARGHYEARLSVEVEEADTGDHVRLVVHASDGPIVRLVWRGDAVPADRRDELVPVAREGSADEDLLEDATNRIQAYFRGLGYRDATAPHVREVHPGEVRVTFTVTRGRRYLVDRVELAGATAVAPETLRPLLRTAVGQPFSQLVLDGDLAQLQAAYRQQGFTAARLAASLDTGPEAPDGHVPVVVHVAVTESAQTLVRAVRVVGPQAVPTADVEAAFGVRAGQPYAPTIVMAGRAAVAELYANRGFGRATIEVQPVLATDQRQADLTLTIREGTQVLVDHLLVTGNRRTPVATILGAVSLRDGEPLGAAAIGESQRQLTALGIFRRARLTVLGREEDDRRDVLITVEEAPLTTIGYGGGVEVRTRVVRAASDPTVASERVEFAPRGSFEVGRSNFLGRNRSVNLYTSTSLYPQSSPVFANQAGVPASSNRFGFAEYRAIGQYRQPRAFGTGADLRLSGTLEQQIRSSFNFTRRGAGADLAWRVTTRVRASVGYQIQRTRVFNQNVVTSEQRTIDRIFPKVRLSSFVASVLRDSRDDQVAPSRGTYLSASGQVAVRALGSEVGLLKSYLTAQAFRAVPHTRAVVFAVSGRLGMATRTDGQGGGQDLPASERFYAGGDTTVRSFALDRLGVRHVPAQATDTIDSSGFPLGGNALVLVNGELRIPVVAGITMATFVDAGNVFATVSAIDAREIRSAVGLGIRYKSPVGPLRFDVGVKVPRRVGDSRAAWFLTFGEAF